MNGPNFSANSTIYAGQIVTMDTGVPKAVNAAANATTYLIGVADLGSKNAPVSGATTQIADATDAITVWTVGNTTLVSCATASITQGDRLTSNSAGLAITASGTNYYVGVALQSISGGGLVQMLVSPGKNP